jgi:hypothetical protein
MLVERKSIAEMYPDMTISSDGKSGYNGQIACGWEVLTTAKRGRLKGSQNAPSGWSLGTSGIVNREKDGKN